MAIKVVHFNTLMHTTGGVETILRYQLTRDGAWGQDSRFVILFEKTNPAHSARINPVGLTGWSCILEARRRVRREIGTRSTDVAVYHDLWGLAFLSDLDNAKRRLGVIHCPSQSALKTLAQNHHLLDGILCVGEPIVALARALVSESLRDRVRFVPVPIEPPNYAFTRSPMRSRPLLIGYCGRLDSVLRGWIGFLDFAKV